jgi:Domain of unknown function (DUF3883)
MILDPDRIANRSKLILTGLYLAKYDSLGLKRLGFRSFAEAFNVIGYALGSQPASIKNYRDEFDPLFPNQRKGWHKRPIRDYCLKILEQYKGLDLDLFTGLIKSFAGYGENKWGDVEERAEEDRSASGFAKRLITGLAAEHYFESVLSDLLEFRGLSLENTTRLGCGYDFRLHAPDNDRFLAVEVKGLRGLTGGLSLTPREHEAAASLRDRFYLFVVKNFQKSPLHEVFPDPLSSRLEFKRSERIMVQVSWSASV